MDENEKQEAAENGEKYEESGDKKKKDPNRDSSVDMEETTERLVSAGEKNLQKNSVTVLLSSPMIRLKHGICCSAHSRLRVGFLFKSRENRFSALRSLLSTTVCL